MSMSQAAPNGGDDTDSGDNGYRDEFDVPDFVPDDYQGPIAREDSRGNVRRLCLAPTAKTGPCDNYANTCGFHDTDDIELDQSESDGSKPRPFKSIENHKDDAIDATRSGLKDYEVADIIGVSPGWFSRLLSRGKEILHTPDEELNEYERELRQFTKSFNRAKAKGTKSMVDDLRDSDKKHTRGTEFVLERSRGWFNTERREVEQSVSFEDDDQGYEIIDAEGERVHPDRSKEAREKRNQEAQEKMNAMADEDDDRDMPTPAAPESDVQDATFREVEDGSDSTPDQPDGDSGDASGSESDATNSGSSESNQSTLSSGGRTSKDRGPLEGDPGGS